MQYTDTWSGHTVQLSWLASSHKNQWAVLLPSFLQASLNTTAFHESPERAARSDPPRSGRKLQLSLIIGWDIWMCIFFNQPLMIFIISEIFVNFWSRLAGSLNVYICLHLYSLTHSQVLTLSSAGSQQSRFLLQAPLQKTESSDGFANFCSPSRTKYHTHTRAHKPCRKKKREESLMDHRLGLMNAPIFKRLCVVKY